jgi:peptide/nickel transport system permease protein
MALPLQLEPSQAFLMILAVIGLVGWARPARLIRGVVLSAKLRDYVVAARGLGATDAYLLRRHVLPQVLGIALTQAALLTPQYILAEVTLSFFGLGVGEPVPSWGNMLAVLLRYDVLSSYWWMFVPGLALVPVFLLYYVLADALHQRAAAFTV